MPFPRSAGQCLIVASPVKVARTLASLRDGLRPPLTATAPHEHPAPIRERPQSDRAAAPAAAPGKELHIMSDQPEPRKENEKEQYGNSGGTVKGRRIISYNLTEEQRPGGLKVRFKVRVETGKKAAAIDAAQADAIRELLLWSREHRARRNGH